MTLIGGAQEYVKNITYKLLAHDYPVVHTMYRLCTVNVFPQAFWQPLPAAQDRRVEQENPYANAFDRRV
jgi:hypothetical protein